MRKNSGFTLIELVAIIAIIGILAAITGPKIVGNDSFAARGAYGTLMSALRLAQKTAITQRKNIYVDVNSTTRVVRLSHNAAFSTPVVDPQNLIAYNKTLPSTTNLTTSTNPIIFTGSGQVNTNNIVILTVTNNQSNDPVRTITIERDTGYIH